MAWARLAHEAHHGNIDFHD